MAPPMTAVPARILSPFTISLLKNSALTGGASVDSEECAGGHPPEATWCDGANPSGSVVAGFNRVSCGGGGSISDVPEL